MITLELYKQNWNTKYLQYNPKKYVVSFRPINENFLDVKADGIGEKEGLKRSYGLFNSISVRSSEPPKHCDVEVWD